MRKRCSICNLETEGGVYNVKQKFVCRTCLHTFPNLHVDDFKIENGKVIRQSPYQDLTEERQRASCIDFIYIIFDRQISPLAFPRLASFIKRGYSWIGIVRTMEWFYVVQKNSISKSNFNVGIVPYVYDKAQDYYEKLNRELQTRFETQILPEIDKTTSKTFIKKRPQ